MALRGVWWMKPPTPATVVTSSTSNTAPHKSWLAGLASQGLAFNDLHEYLRKRPGNACTITKLVFGDLHGKLLWREASCVRDVTVLEKEVNEAFSPQTYCHLYVVTVLHAEALQVLAFHLNITPRFFNIPSTMISTGNTVEKFAFFSLQIFEKYAANQSPEEATRMENPPRIRFREKSGHAAHEWNLTRISLIFIRRASNNFDGVILLDPCDVTLRDGIQTLAVRSEDPLPGVEQHKLGLCDIITEVFYIIQYTWGIFIQESEDYLRILSKTCVENELSASDQLTYTRELHKVAPIWVEARRRITCAADLTQQMINHPFFIKCNAQETIRSYLDKTKIVLDDHISRTNELANQTNVLISLIFNIATLQDTRAAVEESKAANQLASSIRRFTVIAFIYLPMTFITSLFGMNIREISGNKQNPTWWAYMLMSFGMAIITIAIWSLWSWHIKHRST